MVDHYKTLIKGVDEAGVVRELLCTTEGVLQTRESDTQRKGVAATLGPVAANQTIGDIIPGTGAVCTGYSRAVVEVLCAKSDNEMTVQPLFINAAGTAYAGGEKRFIVANEGVGDDTDGWLQRFVLDVDGCADVNFLVTDMVGTTPAITFTVIPVN